MYGEQFVLIYNHVNPFVLVVLVNWSLVILIDVPVEHNLVWILNRDVYMWFRSRYWSILNRALSSFLDLFVEAFISIKMELNVPAFDQGDRYRNDC